ncbi:2,3-dimethylmalate lyase [Symbiodinium microadriaticum]|uniref:2,3-dimethylmalate lyase n=2 Tax=Symbiodinium TaxID=2949 RepID=A0A1Q9EMX8_SYMMI|nr:2,3-dimethylmalate lyase [Symbiodinium microadriaticum]
MDDDLERAARKHRLQQRHGAIRAQQRQRLQEEQKKAALDVSPADADAMPSSSSRPVAAEQAQPVHEAAGFFDTSKDGVLNSSSSRSFYPHAMRLPEQASTQAEWVPEKAVCAIHFHVRLVSLLLEKLDLPFAQLQELRVSCRRGCKVHASINEGEVWQTSPVGLYRSVELHCPLWSRLWTAALARGAGESEEMPSPATTLCLSRQERELLDEVEIHSSAGLRHLAHASSHLHDDMQRPSAWEFPISDITEEHRRDANVTLSRQEPSFASLFEGIYQGVRQAAECAQKLQELLPHEADSPLSPLRVSLPLLPVRRKGSNESTGGRTASIRKQVSFSKADPHTEKQPDVEVDSGGSVPGTPGSTHLPTRLPIDARSPSRRSSVFSDSLAISKSVAAGTASKTWSFTPKDAWAAEDDSGDEEDEFQNFLEDCAEKYAKKPDHTPRGNGSGEGNPDSTDAQAERKPCWRRSRMIHPQSRKRLFWDALSVAMIGFDVIMLPMIYGMSISETVEVLAVEWVCTIFWSIDMFMTFVTGYTVGPEVVMAPRKLMEMTGSLRLLIIFNVLKMATLLLLAVHFFSVGWHFVGFNTVGGWVDKEGFLEAPAMVRYVAAVRWTLAQLNGRTDRQERTFVEMLYIGFTACFTLIFMSIFVSSLTSRMLQLQQLMDRESGYKRLLQRYREMHSLSFPLLYLAKRHIKDRSTLDSDLDTEAQLLRLLPVQTQLVGSDKSAAMASPTKPSLKSLLAKGELLIAPGIFDGISARVAEQVGFKALYMTGFGTVGSHLGLPDAGLASYRDMVERVRTLTALTSVPVICDGDTGFGGLLNVAHTVKGYEEAGASAIQLEDQEFPKKCGHTPGRKVIPFEQAVAKIRVAAEARTSPDFLIVARTDARTNLGLEEAIRRAKAFAEAGADLLFVEAPESEAEMKQICDELAPTGKAMLVNAVEGGKTPVLPRERYIELGYQVAIYPATGFLAMGKALEKVYRSLRNEGSSHSCQSDLANFKGFCVTMGFQHVWDFDKEHADLEEVPPEKKHRTA